MCVYVFVFVYYMHMWARQIDLLSQEANVSKFDTHKVPCTSRIVLN